MYQFNTLMAAIFNNRVVLGLIALLMACQTEIEPCSASEDLEFKNLKGEVRFDDRFGRTIILEIHTAPPIKIDGTNYYIPCNLPDELIPGSKIMFSGKGARIDPNFNIMVAGDEFYSITISEAAISEVDN